MDNLILLAIASPQDKKIVLQTLAAAHYENLSFASSSQEVVDAVRLLKPELVIIDDSSLAINPLEIGQALRDVDVHMITITAHTNSESRANLFMAGIQNTLHTPVSSEELLSYLHMWKKQQVHMRHLLAQQSQARAELNYARSLQFSCVPKHETIEKLSAAYHFQLSYVFRPYSTLGGDFWGMIPLDSEHMGLFIYDFSGQGIRTMLNISLLYSIMMEEKSQAYDPAKYLTVLNKKLKHILPFGMFASMFYGVYEPKTHTMSFSGAAAMPPLVIRAREQVLESLDSTGFPIGAVNEAEYHNSQVQILPGDVLLLYSDALVRTASQTRANDVLSFLTKNVHSSRDISSNGLVSDVMQYFYAEYEAHLADDLTVLAFQAV